MLKGELMAGNVFAIGQRVPHPPGALALSSLLARIVPERLQPSLLWLVNHFSNFQVFACWPDTKRMQGPIFYAFSFFSDAVFARKKPSSTR